MPYPAGQPMSVGLPSTVIGEGVPLVHGVERVLFLLGPEDPNERVALVVFVDVEDSGRRQDHELHGRGHLRHVDAGGEASSSDPRHAVAAMPMTRLGPSSHWKTRPVPRSPGRRRPGRRRRAG